MKFNRLSYLLIASTFIFSGVQAQNQTRSGNWCGFDKQIEAELQNNPNFLQEYFQHISDLKKTNTNNKLATYTIPVVVHNITHSGGLGYVTKQVIEEAIERLNIDFNRLNSDTTQTRSIFKPHAGSIDIEFRLAHLDPNGDCTEGIVRLEHPASADFGDNDKSISQWDEHKYFNIWLVDAIEQGSGGGTGVIAGYAQFPYGWGGGINNTYGIVVDNSFFGANDRTLTHEVGHCFGLLHTFQSGCGGNCSTSGDGLCDTPPALTQTFGCNQSQNSCSNDASGPDPYGTNVVDQIENYMSYDNCQNMFTQDQVATMVSVLNSTSTTQGLAQLNTTANLNATGTNDPYTAPICTPIADFSYNKEYICAGDTVTFTDMSYNATPTSWNWTFTGGAPNSSSVQNPQIVYNTPGVYSAVHEPGTSAGTDVISKANIITVSSLTADYVGPFLDSYENVTQYSNDWRLESGSGQTWQNTTSAAKTGSRSVRIRNYFNQSGNVYALISPSYDISTMSNKIMTFQQAFAKRSSGNNDRLMVSYSIDCGATWILKVPLQGSFLATAPDHSSEFVPTSNEWTMRTVDLTSIGSESNVRFKFEFQSGGGNNIYIDDINISGTTTIDEFDNIATFNVYPNPAKSGAKISFNLIKDVNNLSIIIKNALGQNVTNVINGQSFNLGKYTLNIDEQRNLAPGLYFIEFNADNNIKTQKLIIQ